MNSFISKFNGIYFTDAAKNSYQGELLIHQTFMVFRSAEIEECFYYTQYAAHGYSTGLEDNIRVSEPGIFIFYDISSGNLWITYLLGDIYDMEDTQSAKYTFCHKNPEIIHYIHNELTELIKILDNNMMIGMVMRLYYKR
ncbi:hypothetical protein HZS_1707 [Henneguya salminicola]|nr:hypothetical protein HZS_1707 [Henneguya salminicola]